MSSASTVYRPLNFRGSQDLGNATTESYFLNNISQPVVLPLQNDGQWINSYLLVRIAGRVTTTSTQTFTMNLYFTQTTQFGTAATTGNILMFSTGANTINTVRTSYQMDLGLFWNNDAKKIEGMINTGRISYNTIGSGTLINSPTADPNLHNTSNSFQNVFYGLVVTGQFGGANPGNHAYLDVFALELL